MLFRSDYRQRPMGGKAADGNRQWLLLLRRHGLVEMEVGRADLARQKSSPGEPGLLLLRIRPDYFAAISAAVMSSMRLLKPHSLSYQASTFTSVPPVTLVSVASYTDERGSWLKSTDTSGAVL